MQVQKYEGGANRVSASRLSAMADILGVPISFFFGDLQLATMRERPKSGSRASAWSGRRRWSWSPLLRHSRSAGAAAIPRYGEGRRDVGQT